MTWLLWLTLAHAKPQCYSLGDIRSAVCFALCRSDGSDLGHYEEKSHACVCGIRKDFKEITRVGIKILPPIVAPQIDRSQPKEQNYSPFGEVDEE